MNSFYATVQCFSGSSVGYSYLHFHIERSSYAINKYINKINRFFVHCNDVIFIEETHTNYNLQTTANVTLLLGVM